MKLWLLEAREGLADDINPWDVWYDKAFGFVVRAESEEQARQIATESAGDEIRGFKDAWTNQRYSTCIELSPDGDAAMIIRDYARA